MRTLEKEQPKMLRAWSEAVNILAQFIESKYPEPVHNWIEKTDCPCPKSNPKIVNLYQTH